MHHLNEVHSIYEFEMHFKPIENAIRLTK